MGQLDRVPNALGAGLLLHRITARAFEIHNNVGRGLPIDAVHGRDELVARLSALTKRFSRADLLAKLEAMQVPAGPINPLDQVFTDPQVVHRGMRIERPSAAAKGGTIPGVRTPIVIDGRPMAAERPAPRLGEHTAEILREIGEA